MDLKKDGCIKIQGFESKHALQALNAELDEIFRSPTINFSYGYIRISKICKAVPIPFVFIRSLNLINLVGRVVNIFEQHGIEKDTYYLSQIEIFSEEGDKRELAWHTDHSGKGLLAILYLMGGDRKAGGAQYMRGTHALEHAADLHFLDESTISKYQNSIVDLSGESGDLVLYHLKGFHSRHPTNQERRIVRLSFSPKNFKSSGSNSKYNADDFPVAISMLNQLSFSGVPDFLKANATTLPFKNVDTGHAFYLNHPFYVGTKELMSYAIRNFIFRVRRRFKLR